MKNFADKLKLIFEKIGQTIIALFMLLSPILSVVLDVVGALPIMYFRFPFCWLVTAVVAVIFHFIGEWSRIPIIILYITGLIYVINTPQNVTSIIYYILFALVVIFEVIPFIIGLFSSFANKK